MVVFLAFSAGQRLWKHTFVACRFGNRSGKLVMLEAAPNKSDKSARGNASQFFVAGELCRRDLVALVTIGNTPNTDILCSNKAGTKFFHIQVKTFVPGNRTVSVGLKAEKNYGDNFIWVLGGIPHANQDRPFEYYIIPSPVLAKHVSEDAARWLSEAGKNGHVRKNSHVSAKQ